MLQINNLSFFLMGIFVFSSLTSEICLNFLKLPINLPEILLFPFLFLLKNKIHSISLDKQFFKAFVFLLCLLFGFSIITNEFSLSSILSNARVWFYLFLFYALFRKKNDITYNDLMYLSLGALAGWAIVCILNFRLLNLDEEESSTAIYGTMLAIPIFLSVALHKKNKILLCIGFIFLFIILTLSGLRRAMFVVALVLFLYFAIILVNDLRKMLSVLMYLLLSILLIVIILPYVEDLIKETSYSLYHRVFVRTEILLTEGIDASSDTARFNNFTEFINNFWNYTVPHGFISHQTGKYEGVGLFNDFPLTQICWIFSWPIALFILGYFCLVSLKNYILFKRTEEVDYLLSTISLIVMFSLLFLEGTFLTYPYTTPLTGLLLSKAVTSSNRGIIKSIFK